MTRTKPLRLRVHLRNQINLSGNYRCPGIPPVTLVSLSQCSVDIGDLLNDSVVNGGDEEPSIELRQLHICVNELLVEWET